MSPPPKSDDEISAPEDGAKAAKRGRPRARKAAEPEAVRQEEKAEIFVPERRSEPEPAADTEPAASPAGGEPDAEKENA